MRKAIGLAVLILFLMAAPALAVTFAAVGTASNDTITAITGVDNSVIYLGSSKGVIYSQDISTGAFTKLATIPKEKITAIVYPGATYTYAGTASGKVWRHTISGNALSESTLASCRTPGQAIVGMKWDATLAQIWITTNKGRTYSCKP